MYLNLEVKLEWQKTIFLELKYRWTIILSPITVPEDFAKQNSAKATTHF